jgi:N-acetylglutamate synthase-like GNAT family acetyltransferase
MIFQTPAQRQRGVGRALIQRVVSEAAANSFLTLYLFTPSAEAFFSHLGWSIVEHARYRNADVTIIARQVA